MKTNRKSKIKIFILCWLTYVIIYFARLNLSVALPKLQETLNFSRVQLALIGTGFFWIYGLGQLINGYVGDKVSSRIFIGIGIFLSGVINILFSLTNKLSFMIILWAFNGYALSMIWGPMVKILNNWFDTKERNTLSISISTSSVVGILFTWYLTSILVRRYNWSYAFAVPGITLCIYSFIWYIFIRNSPPEKNKPTKKTEKEYTLKYVFKTKGLYYLIPTAFCQGIIKDSICLWGPLFLMEKLSLNLSEAMRYILLLPIINFIGIIAAGIINKKIKFKPKMTIKILLCISLLVGIIFVQKNYTPLVTLIFLGIISASIYGVNCLLLSYIPLSVGKFNKASTIAGLLDFCSYFAAGVSVYATGYIVEKYRWDGVIILWIASIIIALLFLVLNNFNKKTYGE